MGFFFKTQKEKLKSLQNKLEQEKVKTEIAKEHKAQGIKPGKGGKVGGFVRALKASGITVQPNPAGLFGAPPPMQPKPKRRKRRKTTQPKIIYQYQ